MQKVCKKSASEVRGETVLKICTEPRIFIIIFIFLHRMKRPPTILVVQLDAPKVFFCMMIVFDIRSDDGIVVNCYH